MASSIAYNYLLQQTNNTVTQIAGAQGQAAQLKLVSQGFQRTILTSVFASAADLFAAGSGALASTAIKIADAPTLEIFDTSGAIEYSVTLPSRKKLIGDYYSYLCGSGYNPSSSVEANEYYANIQSILPTQTDESKNFAILDTLAYNAESQFTGLLETLKISNPVVREFCNALAWEAGDGGDRSRQLLGYAFTSLLTAAEIDDPSSPGVALTKQRIQLRTPSNAPLDGSTSLADSTNSLLDEITGNLATDITNCFTPLTPEGVAANTAAIDSVIRFTPDLQTTAGINAAIAEVQARGANPDITAEALAELTPKGTSTDPVFLAIQAAASSAISNGFPDPTSNLLAIEAAASSFVQAGSGNPVESYIAVGLTPDSRLTGYRRREGIAFLRNLLIPTRSVAVASEVLNLIWSCTNRTLTVNPYTTSVYNLYETALADQIWNLKAYVAPNFITPADLTLATSLAGAAITGDLTQPTTQLTSADLGNFNDVLTKLATIAVTPEDRSVQFQRIQDIIQRMSNFANVPLFRYYVEVMVGGGYLAEIDYTNLYSVLLPDAINHLSRDQDLISAELLAFGNITFSDVFANSLLAEAQGLSNNFFTEEEVSSFVGNPLPAVLLGNGAECIDRYWVAVAGTQAKGILDTAIQLSRTLNTLSGEAATTATATALSDLALIGPWLSNPTLATQIFNALVSLTKTPITLSQEAAFVNSLTAGNPTRVNAYATLSEAVTAAVNGITVNLPSPIAPSVQRSATALAYYPLSLFAKNNIYDLGITINAADINPQGGQVLSNIGNAFTIYSADPNVSVPYGSEYPVVGINDVISEAIYDPTDYTFNGEQPTSTFVSGRLDNPNFIIYYSPDIRPAGSAASLISALQGIVSNPPEHFSVKFRGISLGGGSSNASSIANLTCQMTSLTNMINMLNGTINAATGAVIGGINNAINSLNSTVSGLKNSLNSLITSVGNMGSVNLGINCSCIAFNFSASLQALIKPVSSWLTSFFDIKIPNITNPFAGLQNPFNINVSLGCNGSTIGSLGNNPISG